MNNEFNEALERLDMLTAEIERIKRALLAAKEGVPFTEAWNEEVFLEAKQDEKKGRAYLSRMIEHLLKAKYCTNDRNYDHWRGEINTFRTKTIDITGWKSKRNKDTNLINTLTDDLDDIYEVAIEYYEDDAKEYPDLIDGLELIPEECPWNLADLMNNSIDELLDKLPIKKEGGDNLNE